MSKSVKFTPEWNRALEGYIVKFLWKHEWRIHHTMEHEDLMQESRLIFVHIRNKYPDVENAKHFMSLFKTAWYNHFTDLTIESYNYQSNTLFDCDIRTDGVEDDSLNYLDNSVGDLDGSGMLATLIRQAPTEVKSILSLLFNAPAELLELVCMHGGSKHLNRSLNIPNEIDLVKMVKDYFTV